MTSTPVHGRAKSRRLSSWMSACTAFAVVAAAATSQPLPLPLPLPTKAVSIGDNVVMVYSDHIANPIYYGVVSALTLGLYPHRFGDDLIPRATGNERWPQSMSGLLKAEAKKSFAVSRNVFAGFMLLTCALLLFRYFRRKLIVTETVTVIT